MSQSDQKYSTQVITPQLISQIVDAIRNKAYGSIEIYIQNHRVVQITERTITKVGQTTTQKTYTRETDVPKEEESEVSPSLNRNQ